MSRKRLFSYAIGIILVIALLSIYLMTHGRAVVKPASTLAKGQPTIVASATIASTNEQPTATSIPLLATNGQSTGTTSTSASGGQCGDVEVEPSGTLTDPNTAQQAERCFWQAYQQCHTASLILTFNQKDLVSTHSFQMTQQNGTCIIIDTNQDIVAGQPPSPLDIYQCRQVTTTAMALHFLNCGEEENVDIPSS